MVSKGELSQTKHNSSPSPLHLTSHLALQKLLSSALANAKNLSMPTEGLIVKEIRVDAGATLYRHRPRSKGMANPIRKRTSHISVILAESKAKS